MRKRRGEIIKGNCFIIFQERRDSDDPNDQQLTESKALVCESVLEGVASDEGLGSTALDETVEIHLPDEGWRGDDSQSRFIQFRFNPRCYDMDIPNTTLYKPEAEDVLRRRSGFFYLGDRRQFEYREDDGRVERFNPLRKVYVYGDERSAAEDMAYVWFNVWRFPVDWRFYVTAGAFDQRTNWERGFPIE